MIWSELDPGPELIGIELPFQVASKLHKAQVLLRRFIIQREPFHHFECVSPGPITHDLIDLVNEERQETVGALANSGPMGDSNTINVNSAETSRGILDLQRKRLAR
mgnify:CR=1 FL=1